MKYRIKYTSLDTQAEWHSAESWSREQAKQIMDDVVADHRRNGLNVTATLGPATAQNGGEREG